MESDTIIATPVADVVIILGDEKRVRVHVNSTILRNASEKFDTLLGPVLDTRNDQKPDENVTELPTVHLADCDVAQATRMLRYLHRDYDESDTLDCVAVLNLSCLVHEYEVIPTVGARLEMIIATNFDTCDDDGDLSNLLYAANNINAPSKFREISAKLVRASPKTSFYEHYLEHYPMEPIDSRFCIALQAKRAQIDAKIIERLLPALQQMHKCGCIDKPDLLRLIMGQVHPCMNVKDGRTPQERMDQLELAREELGRLEESDPQVCSSGTHKNCLLRKARMCLGHAFQDARELSYEGISLEDVVEEKNDAEGRD